MSLRRFLGLEPPRGEATAGAETATVRRIVEALDRLDPEAARYVARFAYILARVADADLDISADETRAMERAVMERGGLPEEQAVIVVHIARSQNVLFGGTENYLVTREFAARATHGQKRALLDCCFAVSAADHDVSSVEDAEIRKIAHELGLEHAEFIAARSAYRDYLSVLKRAGQ